MSLLLCHIANSIGTSAEDIATMSLHYILQNSPVAKEALLNFIGTELAIDFEQELHFEIQSCGENKERPDMSLRNQSNDEILLFEMKFWAGLTDNQPNAYIERLKKKNGKGLVFICPNSRLISLSKEVAALAEYETQMGRLLQKKDFPPILIMSWEELIDLLEPRLQLEPFYNDLLQLKGLTGEMNNQDFRPFSLCDLSSDMATRIIDYYRIVDKIADSLIIHNFCNSKGLQASPQKDGYCRYLKVESSATGIGISYSCNLWQKGLNGKTSPFWIAFQAVDCDNNWCNYPAELRCKLESSGKEFIVYRNRNKEVLAVPLYALRNTNEYETVENLVKQAKDIIELL
ncbi:MAG: hypothetical protein ACLSUS_00360 [Opitutales bacterium]